MFLFLLYACLILYTLFIGFHYFHPRACGWVKRSVSGREENLDLILKARYINREEFFVCVSTIIIWIVLRHCWTFFSHVVLIVLPKFLTFILSCSRMASQGIQEAYQMAAKEFNAGASSIGMAIEHAKSKNWEVAPDNCEKAIKELLKKDSLYTTHGVKTLLHIKKIPKTVVGHFDTGFVPAVNTINSKQPSISPIPLTPYVSKHISKIEAAKSKFTQGVGGQISGYIPRPPSAIVTISVISLKSKALVSQSNAGITLVLGLDGRAREPQDAILGGHLHFAKDSNLATSLFFPNLSLTSEEEKLDSCVQVWTSAQGYDLTSGFASSTNISMIGEVSADAVTTSMLVPMRQHIEAQKFKTLCHGGLPIHPYRATENKIDTVELDWTSTSTSMEFDSSKNGVSLWKPSHTSGTTSLRFTGLKMSSVKEDEELHFSDNDEGFLPPNPRERTRAYEEGLSDEITETQDLLDGQEKLIGEACVLSKTFALPDVVDNCHLVGVINLFEDTDVASSGEPLLANLRTATIFIPKIQVRVRYSLPSAYNCPVIVTWDEARCITEVTDTIDLTQLPHIIVTPNKSVQDSSLDLSLNGITGTYSLARVISRRAGNLLVSCTKHDFAEMVGEASVTVEVWLMPGTVIGKGFKRRPAPERPILNLSLVENYHTPLLEGPTDLGSVTLDANTERYKCFSLFVKPGVGAVTDDRMTTKGSTISSVCSHWAMWSGTAVIEISISARSSVAGQMTVYTVPTGTYVHDINRSVCNQWERRIIKFNGPDHHEISASANSWLGGCSTMGEAFMGSKDQNGSCMMFVVFVDDPPSSCAGYDSSVQVFFSLKRLENLNLFERITPQIYRASQPSKALVQRKPWVERVIKTAPTGAVEQNFGVQPTIFHRMYTIRNIKRDKPITWILPFTVAEPLRSNWKNCKVTNYEHLEKGKDEEPLLLIDTTNPYRLLTQGFCYFSGEMQASVSVTSTKKKAGSLIVGRFKSPYFTKEIGCGLKDADIFGGGLMETASLLPGNVAYLTQPARPIIRSSCRPDVEKSHQATLDIPSYICIIVPANSDITEIEVGFNVNGPLELFGHALPQPVDLPKTQTHGYLPALTVLDVKPAFPFGWWDMVNERAIKLLSRQSTPTLDVAKLKTTRAPMKDEIFRMYHVFEMAGIAEKNHSVSFLRPNFTPHQGYAINLQIWVGDSRDKMFEVIWRFDSSMPQGYITTYVTDGNYEGWNLNTCWKADFDRFKGRERFNLSYTRDKGRIYLFDHNICIGYIKDFKPTLHCVFGWEYQLDTNVIRVPNQYQPYSFNPSGGYVRPEMDAMEQKPHLLHIQHTNFQSNTHLYDHCVNYDHSKGPVRFSDCGGFDPSFINPISEENVRNDLRGEDDPGAAMDYGPTELLLADVNSGVPRVPIHAKVSSGDPSLKESEGPIDYKLRKEPIERNRVGVSNRKKHRRGRPKPKFPEGVLVIIDESLYAERLSCDHVHFRWRYLESVRRDLDYFICKKRGYIPKNFGCCWDSGERGEYIPKEFLELAEECILKRMFVAFDPENLVARFHDKISPEKLDELVERSLGNIPTGCTTITCALRGAIWKFNVRLVERNKRQNSCGCCGQFFFVVDQCYGCNIKPQKRGGFHFGEGRPRPLDGQWAHSWEGGIENVTSDLEPIINVQTFEDLKQEVALSLWNEERNNVSGYLESLATFHPGALGL
nr:polyprotein [Strawberry mottle virus]